MILGEVEETITNVEIDEETYEELFKVCVWSVDEFVCMRSSYVVTYEERWVLEYSHPAILRPDWKVCGVRGRDHNYT